MELVLGSDGNKKGTHTRPEIFAFGQLYVALSRVRSIENLHIEGNLESIKTLASPDVLQFYSATSHPLEQAEQIPSLSTTKEEYSEKPKTEKNMEDIISSVSSQTDPDGLQIIECPDACCLVAFTFAKTLDSSAAKIKNGIQISSRYAKNLKEFINAISI